MQKVNQIKRYLLVLLVEARPDVGDGAAHLERVVDGELAVAWCLWGKFKLPKGPFLRFCRWDWVCSLNN